ncbi:PRC and DUF2382 domain-containing protein [Saccharopolyspora sp. HNM0986]|uniref:DUF2382 domain-containing protein n=1 Tax=Saccharopolyspora galaxeae TaxID=2781241 RepID=UPI00190E3379|nr:PRC and DUF2382 domain-containing protein [Saccharopolyspora sp. HNM0986]MBK0866400.1 PRC and DUF2382 domain-containing protein [Saccharopolyspora sp. HNM0986]
MKDVKRAQDLIGSDVYDTGGERIGRVGNVYVDDSSHQPEWVTVRTGMFGTKESFVPLTGAERSDRGINVGVSKEKVRDAPRVDVEHGHLSDNEGRDLYTYYGMQPGSTSPQQRDVPRQQSTGGTEGAAAGTATAASGSRTTEQETRSSATGSETGTASTSAAGTASTTTGATETGSMSGTRQSGATAQRTAGESTARGDSAGMKSMTRCEERLRINTEQAESGRVRVRKYVVTEQQSVTVPVSHEEVRIEREPISESERGSMSSARMGEEEQEVVLHEDRPTVSKESVPVERIRLRTETVTEERTVQDEVRMERFDVQDQSGRHHERSDGRGSSGRTETGGSGTGGQSGSGGQSGTGGQRSGGGTPRS